MDNPVDLDGGQWEEDWEEDDGEEGGEEGEEDDADDVWVGIEPLVRQLVEAAEDGNVAQVGALLDQGVDIEARNASGESSLHWTSRAGRVQVIDLLLLRGADIEAANAYGWTPILFASRNGYIEVVELLHARGANIHYATVDHRDTALQYAAWNDHLPVCEFLLSKGADLMAADNDGWTALSHYGEWSDLALSPETKALRIAALEATWAAGPHPSQVQRRRDDRWFRRGPLLWVLAEHAYRPLQLRAQAIAAAAVGAPLPVVQYSPKEDVLRSEGLVRYIVAFL